MSNEAWTRSVWGVAWPVVRTLTWRACQIFVVGPGSIAALALVVAAMMGEEPIRGLVAANYEWADRAFRSAPAGTVLDVDGPELRKQIDAGSKSLRREPTPLHPVPINKAIDDTAQWLGDAYWILVGLAAIYFLALTGPFEGRGVGDSVGVDAVRGGRRHDE